MITFAAMSCECCHPVGQAIIISHDASSIPVGAQVFAWIEGEGRNVSEGPHELSMVSGEMGLGAIFYDPKIVLLCDGHDYLHVRRLPVQVDRNDSDRSGRDLSFDFQWIDSKSVLIRVAEDDPAASLRDRLGC